MYKCLWPKWKGYMGWTRKIYKIPPRQTLGNVLFRKWQSLLTDFFLNRCRTTFPSMLHFSVCFILPYIFICFLKDPQNRGLLFERLPHQLFFCFKNIPTCACLHSLAEDHCKPLMETVMRPATFKQRCVCFTITVSPGSRATPASHLGRTATAGWPECSTHFISPSSKFTGRTFL